MAISVSRLSSSRERFTNSYGLDVNSGSLGSSVTINTSSNFSVIPPSSFSMYYHIYIIQTDAAITVTLPTTTNVTQGWRAKFILVSNAGTGSITFSDGTNSLYNVSDVGTNPMGIEAQLNASTSTYRFSYYLNNTNKQTVPVYYIAAGTSIVNPIPKLKSASYGQFFSYSGIVGSTTLNANTTTPVVIPWDSNTPGRYVDTDAFDTTVSSRIYPRFPCILRITFCICIASSGGATNVNVLRFLNGSGGVQSISETSGTISATTNQVIYGSTIISVPTVTATTYGEFSVNKSVVSIGTNIVDRTNSYFLAEFFVT